ncbi:hypothetical protein FG93_01927 [Bosea sp. LC85]|uniref:hypothetical protein n=1 Tax=Bosea sp. LC85 TaxID=1502851 RepID=UPI0004E3F099|nr:hypothetical protein [Bosea sp. LC85]KFC73183.1 hypothetical protein FG93_01927 [Bosea sp. LC85]
MNWDFAQQYFRIGLYKAAAALVTAGFMLPANADVFVSAGLELTGLALAGVTLVWTRYWNRKREA